jgi:PIN domain nuclease of toxin-antitoxin system
LSTFVLDASGLLAYLHDEEGAAEVADALGKTATMSAANLAEALSKLAERGANTRDVVGELEERGVLGGLIEVEPLTVEDAVVIAELIALTRERGLGLGERACLALGRRLGLPVMTADRAWAEVEEAVGVQVYAIR